MGSSPALAASSSQGNCTHTHNFVMKAHNFLFVIVLAVLLSSYSIRLLGAEAFFVFETPHQEREFEQLLKEFRCVTCPNQNIADSQAPVAQAMQEEIYHRLQQGESMQAIRDFLQAQYGDYVLYRPVLSTQTYFLWFGPFLMFMAGLIAWLQWPHSKKHLKKERDQ